MAIGDYIIQMGAQGAGFTYVPVGSNIFMILSSGNGGQASTEKECITDGLGTAQYDTKPTYTGNNNRQEFSGALNSKILIDNTYYFHHDAGAASSRGWFCAVQVA